MRNAAFSSSSATHRQGLDRRPAGVDDDTVEALGKLSEALEWIERARGRLYDFHQMCGHADFLFGDAADLLERAGHREAAEAVRTEIVGRNVIEGRWTFQLVEEFDATYWSVVRAMERDLCEALIDGVPHVLEAELKSQRTTDGHPAHRATPFAD